MQIHAITAGALLAALPLVQAAGSVIIHNTCDFDVYLWSVDTDTTPSTPTKLASGGQYKESYKTPASGGVSLKLSNDSSDSGAITQVEYTLDGFIWYDLSNVNCKGSACPFQKYGMYMESGSGCPTVSCAAGDLICKGAYNDPDDNENSLSCDSTADTQVYLCAESASGSSGSPDSTSAGSIGSSAAPSASSTPSSTPASSSAVATSAASSVATPDYNQPSSAASATSAVASAAQVAAASPTTLLTTAAPAAVTVYTTVTAATTTTQWVHNHAARHQHHPRNFRH